MNFYFTRHGETEWNVKKKIQGTTDIPLDEKGIQQAKRLAETLLEKQRNGELHLDRVYTSPQRRPPVFPRRRWASSVSGSGICVRWISETGKAGTGMR